jgi:hypothetical protein
MSGNECPGGIGAYPPREWAALAESLTFCMAGAALGLNRRPTWHG